MDPNIEPNAPAAVEPNPASDVPADAPAVAPEPAVAPAPAPEPVSPFTEVYSAGAQAAADAFQRYADAQVAHDAAVAASASTAAELDAAKNAALVAADHQETMLQKFVADNS